MGKWEIRPTATPKTLNRSSPKVAYVITSWVTTHTQNLVIILQGYKGFLFPICAKLHIKNVYSASFSRFFQQPTAQAPEQIFMQNISNDVGHAIMCLLGLENKNLTFNSLIPQNRHFWAHF